MQIHGYIRGITWGRVSKSLILSAFLCGALQGSPALAQEVKSEPPATQTAPKEDEVEQLRKTVRQLTAEVARLKAENAKLEKYRQVDYLRDLLSKEELRVQAAQKELADMGTQEIALQKRLDEIESQLRPGQIERSRAGLGSTRPEEDREAAQRQLSNEKRRIQSQLEQFQQNRVRLQSAIRSAEASIITLRLRLKDALQAARFPNAGMN